MKKLPTLIILLAVLGAVAYFVTNKKGKLNASADISIADTSIVAKLFLTDMQGHKIVLIKKNSEWLLNDSIVARKDGVQSILETLHRIEPVQPVPTSAHNNIVNELSATGVKVELFDANNATLSSFTIGSGTTEGAGNYIYKKGCDRPYIYNKPGFIGDLSIAFFTDFDDWRSREIIKYKSEDIEKIDIYYTQNKDSSFYVTQSKAGYAMGCYNGNIIDFSNTKIKDYLKEFNSKFCSTYENHLNTKDSIITQGEKYGYISIKAINQPSDTLHLVFFKANQKASKTREVNGRHFDQEFLLAYNSKDVMVLPTATFSKLLTHPAYFAK